MNEIFGRVARRIAHLAGSAPMFLAAVVLVVAWALSGPLFDFSETWQLVINTGTTIVTFLMVFLIQSSQNHDAVAMQIKLDELIRAVNGAQNSLISLENATEGEMQEEADALHRLAEVQDAGGPPATTAGKPASGTTASNSAAPRSTEDAQE